MFRGNEDSTIFARLYLLAYVFVYKNAPKYFDLCFLFRIQVFYMKYRLKKFGLKWTLMVEELINLEYFGQASKTMLVQSPKV